MFIKSPEMLGLLCEQSLSVPGSDLSLNLALTLSRCQPTMSLGVALVTRKPACKVFVCCPSSGT